MRLGVRLPSVVLDELGVSVAWLTRDPGRVGVLRGVRGAFPPAGVLFEKADGVRSPLRFSFEGGAVRGDSGRGRDGRRILGLAAEGLGPTDLLKFIPLGRDGVGVGGVPVVRLETYLELLIGTKIPEPGTEVVK